MTELWKQNATTLAAMIAAKEVSSREVVDAHLQRIEAVNPRLNAITVLLAESAQEAAAAADRDVAAGGRLGALHGVPCTVKQNIDLVGSATSWGLPALAEALPPMDSPVVERMKAAGAIPIGRTNCPDMALRVHTDSSLHGLTRNPWDATRTAGGSSGGEGSALASGMSPIGLGNDIGGSLRNPASCCGIASIKPTAGRVPLHTVFPAEDGPASFQLMPVEGPMARRIADVRLGLSILEGQHPRDPFSVPMSPSRARPVGRPLRVAALPTPPGGATDPRVAALITKAADTLADAGYDVVATEPPRFAEAIETWARFITADIHMLAPLIGPMMGDDANRFLGYTLATRPMPDLGAYTQVLMTRQSIMRAWSVWMQDVDLVLTPTWTQLPFTHGWDAQSSEHAEAVLDMMRCVTIANVLGLPAACVPAGLVDGIPVGAMLTADRFDDHTALDAAEVIESALGLPTPIDPTF
jgi:amidase